MGNIYVNKPIFSCSRFDSPLWRYRIIAACTTVLFYRMHRGVVPTWNFTTTYKPMKAQVSVIGCLFAGVPSGKNYMTRSGLRTGHRNLLFGVFESACCGAEIVIPSGAVFPSCPNHPEFDTTWTAIEIGPDNLVVLPPIAI